jgi:hypothetical protein
MERLAGIDPWQRNEWRLMEKIEESRNAAR